MRDLTFTSATELLRLYRARKVSPLEVVQAVLARIDAVNPAVNAIVTLARESALDEARRATARLRRGATLSLLFGVPIGIKDVTPTRGLRTTHGSKLFENHVPDEDALVVSRTRSLCSDFRPSLGQPPSVGPVRRWSTNGAGVEAGAQ
jgi:Asp-tRNA(Asn)/Glu-tRNA(Gln) amidotransferase A subunit family amidase